MEWDETDRLCMGASKTATPKSGGHGAQTDVADPSDEKTNGYVGPERVTEDGLT